MKYTLLKKNKLTLILRRQTLINAVAGNNLYVVKNVFLKQSESLWLKFTSISRKQTLINAIAGNNLYAIKNVFLN